MLQLQSKHINICRIGKLLVKYNIKASITGSVITLIGDVSDELLTKLCSGIEINAVQNFISEEPLHVMTETTSVKSEEHIKGEAVKKPKEVETKQQLSDLSHFPSEYDLIYPEVKRGEVYMCDFGKPYGSEQGFMRPAIIIQNDVGNLHSPTTIVIPCTTEKKKMLPTHYNTFFSSNNIIDFNMSNFSLEENIIMAEQIQTVDKSRLRKYLGTLTHTFIKTLEDKIDISLHLNREVKAIVTQEKIPINDSNAMVNAETPKQRKDVNMFQVQLLSLVDIKELLRISQSTSTDEVKAQKILDLFGFDCKQNGVHYLLKAIITSPKNAYFNLETLSESISRTENIDKEEIKRLIVARVKENFGFRKTPAIDFIRLVNNFLTKQEVNYEEINI